jgi:cytidylate kinase
MSKNIGLEQCQSFIACQLRAPGGPFGTDNKPAITISRMTGCGGRDVAARLADFLQTRATAHCPWTVFDRNLVEKVLEEHYLPKWVAEYMPEGHRPMVTDAVEELLGLHPASWTLVQQTSETIWRLARMGYVILVGRGANIVTSKLPTVFHVRLVASLEQRSRRVQEKMKLTHAAALEFIKKEDLGRRRYIKEHFAKEIDDPLLYHLIINTDHISVEEAAILVGRAVIDRFDLAKNVPEPLSLSEVVG